MVWLIYIAMVWIIVGVGFLVYLIISEIIQSVRKAAWLEKMEELDRKNYVEFLLEKSPTLSPLYSLAKEHGISFKTHPRSFELNTKKGEFIWSSSKKNKKIEISLDQKSLQIIPFESTEQINTMGHEIGHIISSNSDFDPPCYQDPRFRLLSRLETGEINCFFNELNAEITGWRILEQACPNFDISNLKERFLAVVGRECKACEERIQKRNCPKKEEIESLLKQIDDF